MARYILLLLLALPVLAQGEAPLSEAERQSLQAKSDALIKEAKDRRAAADDRQRKDKAECYQRFLVNSCLEDADARHLHELEESKKLELEGNRLHREVKASERAERAAKTPAGIRESSAPPSPQNADKSRPDTAEQGAERQREKAGRKAQETRQMDRYASARSQQAARALEARHRAEEAKKQTAAYQAAQDKAKASAP